MNFKIGETNNINCEEDIKLLKLLDKTSSAKFSIQITRPCQQNFRTNLINWFTKCPITGCEIDECEAAHIIPVSSGGDYVLTNGLLLGAHIHKTFDKFAWSINPSTFQIESNNKSGSVVKYIDSIDLSQTLDSRWKKSLEWHYLEYIKLSNKLC